jgi:hypothetical protein
MAGAMGVSFTLAFTLFAVTAAAARDTPLGEQKTYAPPYGSDPAPSVPYSPPASVSPVVPTPDVPYTPTPYTPTDPVPTPTPSSPGTCTWWSSNTGSFPDVVSIVSTILDLFTSLTGGSGGSDGGGITSIISSIFGSQMTIYQGLTNTRTDGFGALARQSSAALLNSLTRRDYPFNALQVKVQFRNALGSQQQAFATARMFENANLALGARRH